MSDNPVIALIGPGAIGTTIAAVLHDAGRTPLLCGRTAHPELRLRHDEGETVVPGPVLTDPAVITRPVDLVFAPRSTSILPSITNKSLMQLAEDMGMKVERRPVPEEELLTFEEAGACGTAAVISPIERIDDVENGKSYVISKDGKPGPVCTKLYNKLRAIQYGDEPDTHGWVTIVE